MHATYIQTDHVRDVDLLHDTVQCRCVICITALQMKEPDHSIRKAYQMWRAQHHAKQLHLNVHAAVPPWGVELQKGAEQGG